MSLLRDLFGHVGRTVTAYAGDKALMLAAVSAAANVIVADGEVAGPEFDAAPGDAAPDAGAAVPPSLAGACANETRARPAPRDTARGVRNFINPPCGLILLASAVQV